jgi:hypothetical protein
LTLQVARNPHTPQLSYSIRDRLETTHRNQSLVDETKKKFAAATQVDDLDVHEVSFILLPAHAQGKSFDGTTMKRQHRLLVFGLVANEAHGRVHLAEQAFYRKNPIKYCIIVAGKRGVVNLVTTTPKRRSQTTFR